MAKKEGGTAVQEPGTGISAPGRDVPVELTTANELNQMFEEAAGQGLQNLGAGDLALPFLTIVQKGTPQASRANAKYVKGCEAGMVMNTVTQELYGGEEGVAFIPCGYQKAAVRWGDRDMGGGLVCQYKPDDPILKKFKLNDRGQLFDPETKDVILDTAYHFGLHLRDGLPEFAVISMYSTGLKASRTWNTLMKRIMIRNPKTNAVFNPPSFSHVYRLTTVGMTKDSYDWFSWRITSEGQVTDAGLFKLALEFSKQVEQGLVRVGAPPAEFDDPTGDPAAKEDIPF